MRSNNYAEITDARPILAEMDRHADAGLPFIAAEYPDDYEEETQAGISKIPSYDGVERRNIEGSNAYDAASYRYLLSIAVITQGLHFGNGILGLNIRTSDGRNVVVIPVSKEMAYRPLNDIERKILEMQLRVEFERDSADDL